MRLQGVNFTGSGNGSLSDLDLGEVGDYGEGREVGQLLQRYGGTQGYEALQRPTGLGAFRIFAEEQIIRDRMGGGGREILAISTRNRPVVLRGATVFGKRSRALGKLGCVWGRMGPFGGGNRRVYLKWNGCNLKEGDSEQRRSGRLGNAGGKASRFGRGNADRFRGKCPIWVNKKGGKRKGTPKRESGDGYERRNLYYLRAW